MLLCKFAFFCVLFFITLFKAAEPKITLPLRNMSVSEGQTISFVCEASGRPKPQFIWFHDEKRVKDNRNRYEIKDMPNGSVLRIEPVKMRRDSGKFTCQASNTFGDTYESYAYLEVYPVDHQRGIPQGYPRITVNPKLKSVEKGRDAEMKCEAEASGAYGNDRVKIEWFKDKIPVDLSDERITIIDPGYLQIKDSVDSDHGRYECVASNSVGVAYSTTAMLYVKVRRIPPHFTVQPENVEVDLHTNVNLTCGAIGSPMPMVKFIDGPIELSPEHIGTNTLVLINVTESKNYTCVASSELGNIEHVVAVKVKGKAV